MAYGEEQREHRSTADQDYGDREVAMPAEGAQVHPASRVCSPRSPCGLKTMISTRYAKTTAGVHSPPIRLSEICWMQPMITPPRTAPWRLPMPPMTAAVNAIRPALKPWKNQIVVW